MRLIVLKFLHIVFFEACYNIEYFVVLAVFSGSVGGGGIFRLKILTASIYFPHRQ